MAIGYRDLVPTRTESRIAALVKRSLTTVVSMDAAEKRRFVRSWHGHAMWRPCYNKR
jgi:hypothetical protein